MEKKKVLILLDGSDFSAENPTVTQAGDYLSQVPPQPQPNYCVYPSQQEQSQEANLIAAMTKDARALKDAQ